MPKDCPTCGGMGLTRVWFDQDKQAVCECRECAGCGWVDEQTIVDVSDTLHQILAEALAQKP